MNTLNQTPTDFNNTNASQSLLVSKTILTEQGKGSKRLDRARSRRQSNEHLQTLFVEWAALCSDPIEQKWLLDLANRVGSCCAVWAAGITASGRRGIAPTLHCHVKFCPNCAARRAARMARRFGPAIRQAEKQGHRVRFLTLTVPNVCLGELRTGIKELFAAWSKLRRQKLFKGCVGTLAALDLTIADDGSIHHHLHILLVGGGYIPQASIADAWEKLTGGCMVDIRKTDDERLKELLKYQIKPMNIRSAEQLQGLYEALQGVRAVRATGCLRGLDTELEDDEFDPELDLENDNEFVEVFGFYSIDDPVLDGFMSGSISIDEMRARSRLRVT